MIKKTLLLFAIFASLGILFNSTPTISNNAMPPLGRTAAPGEPSVSCAQSGCHTGNLNAGSADLLINFTGSGSSYQAGQTYNMSVTINASGTRFGFEMLALNAAGQSVGTFTGNAANQTQVSTGTTGVAANRQYVHHLNATNHGNNNTYSFTWTAPTSDQGTITFYAAGNAANGNNAATGDKIYTNSRTISFDPSIGIDNPNEAAANTSVSISPNPTIDHFVLTYGLAVPEKLTGYIYNSMGALVKTIYFDEQPAGLHTQQINLNPEQFTSGVYILYVTGENSRQTCRFVVK